MDEKTMFCYQCEQTAKGKGCEILGVCGKDPAVAALQDLLVYALKGLSLYAVEGRKAGVRDRKFDVFTVKALFSTLTNVNFDADRFMKMINECVQLREELKERIRTHGGKIDFSEGPATFKPDMTLEGLIAQGKKCGLKSNLAIDPDILSLQHTTLFGLKGIAAYADHAQILGQEDER
jgi:hydroxylamine reductase